MSSDSLSSLIEQIYDTALEPARWQDTLDDVSRHIGAAFMSVVPYDDPASITMSKDGEYAMKTYVDYWFKHDAMVKVGIANKHSRELLCDWSSIGLKDIARNAYYQEYRRDAGLGYCIGTTFEAFPGEYRALGINLPLGREMLDDGELAAIGSILRHLARAITISSRVETSMGMPVFAGVLERFRCGAALIDDAGLVIVANGVLRKQFDDGLRITPDGVRCARAECQASLDRLLKAALQDPADNVSADYSLVRRPSGRKPFMARAVPLSPQSATGLWRRLSSRKQVLLLVVDLAAEQKVSCEHALRQLGLTPAEAKVANLVGSGLSPAQAATRQGTTEATVRHQLKQVFSKLDLKRQVDLVQTVDVIRQL